jgi:hypothetical protein
MVAATMPMVSRDVFRPLGAGRTVSGTRPAPGQHHELPALLWTLLAALAARSVGATVTERVSVDSYGVQADWDSDRPMMSADGRFVTFGSPADNLVAGDTNGSSDVFVHDRQTGATERVSVDAAGGQSDSDTYGAASISADGRYVLFSSDANNLVANDTNGASDVFVHDRQTGMTERVSVDSAGAQGNGYSVTGPGAALSSDGRFVVFMSAATNLVPGEANGLCTWYDGSRDHASASSYTTARRASPSG